MNGCQVVKANSKEKLYKTLSSFIPDLILLDVMLKGIDDRELCIEMRATIKTKHMPIILASASAESLKDYEECEANDVIAKPFNINEIIEKINGLL